MTDIASLYIKVDSKGVVTASKDLDVLTGKSQKAEKATDAVSSSFSKQLGLIKQLAMAYGAYKIAQYIKEATMLAARYETLGVVMRTVGNNAGYSGDQMEDFAKSLQSAGISMLASRTVLTRMVQAQLDLAQSSKLARIAQDAAVIGNINSSEAFERMIYGIQSAQTEMLRTIGINVNFENAYQKVADATDRVTTSFSEGEKAQIRLNVVMEAGKGIAGAYEGSMETVGKQVLSLERHVENLKVMLGGAFTPALAEIIGQITKGITDLNGELSGEGQEDITDWGNNFRLTIVSIEAEIMRLAMFIDQVGGTLTSIGLLLTGLPALVGKIPGLDVLAIPFENFADMNIMLEERAGKTDKALVALAGRYNELVEAMTPASKLAAKQAKDAQEAVRLEAVALANLNKEKETATKEQIKIQENFTKAYNESVMNTKDFEIASLNTKLEAFRAAKVSEIQLEEWYQSELKNIKLRAQNEALELYEQLAENDKSYAQDAIDLMSEILDAEEEKWADILESDDDAHKLRIQKEEAYKKTILGTIDEITEAQIDAVKKVSEVTGLNSFVSPSTQATTSQSVMGGTYDTIAGKVFINDRAGARAYAQELDDIKEAAIQTAEQATAEALYIAEQAAAETAQLLIDIAAQRVDLEIQLLEAEGYATEALALQRMQELAAMDESLQPIQKRIWYLEDEATAAEAATEATEALIDAQNDMLDSWEDSVTTLVSQGQTIQDFIDSLGTTSTETTLSAARGAYLSDLAGAQMGDATSYSNITSSAGTYITKATASANTSVEAARIVAGIKSELSSLETVVDLESNTELLKSIKAATEGTATSTERLDLLGIKAIFDLEQTLTLVDNSEGLPDHLKEMIVNQSGDYELFLQAQLDSDTSEDLQRILIDGAGIYATTVTAIVGSVDDESQKLVIDAAGDFETTVNALFGTADANATALAIDAAGEYETTVNALFGSADPNSQKLAINAGGDFLTTVTAVFDSADSESTLFAITAANDYITTVNALFGSADSESQKLALEALGNYTTTVDAILSSDIEDDTKAIALNTTNEILTTVDAVLIANINDDAKTLALNASNTLAATVTASLGFTDSGAITLAMETANDIAATVTAALGSGDVDALTLATESVNTFATTVTAALATDATTQQLQDMLTGSGDLTTTIDGTMSWNPNDPMKSIWEAINSQTAATKVATENTAKGIKYSYLSSSETAVKMYDSHGDIYYITPSGWTASAPGLMTKFQKVANYAEGGIFTNGIVSQPTLFNASQMGEAGPEAIMPLTKIGGKLGVRSDGSKSNIILIEEVRALRAEIKSGNFAIAKNTQKTAKILTDFDYNGMPAERTTT